MQSQIEYTFHPPPFKTQRYIKSWTHSPADAILVPENGRHLSRLFLLKDAPLWAQTCEYPVAGKDKEEEAVTDECVDDVRAHDASPDEEMDCASLAAGAPWSAIAIAAKPFTSVSLSTEQVLSPKIYENPRSQELDTRA